MSIRTVLAHLTPIARKMRSSILPGGGDPGLLFNAITEAAYLVAAADGAVDRTELATFISAVRTLSEDEVDAAELGMLIDDLSDLRTTEGEAARCRAVGELLAEGGAGEEGLYLAAGVAFVSGGLDKRELAVLEKIARAANVSGAELAGLVAAAREEISRRSVVAPPPV